MTLTEYKNKIEKVKGKKEHIEGNLNTLEDEAIRLTEYLYSLEKAQALLQNVAQETQSQLRFHINDLVNLCLDYFWPGQIQFDSVFEIKNGRTVAKLVFVQGGDEIDPFESDGGGLVDIASFALRMVAWTLEKTRNTIILDEPFKNLSEDLQPQGAELLKELSERLNLQFIIVNHRKQITDIADKVFEVTRTKDGDYWKSEVRVL